MLRRILDSPWLYFTLAALLLIAAILSQLEIRLPPRHAGTIDDIARLRERKDLNVVWVVIDTLRADHLSGYGYARSTSPVMDRLAGEGVSFTHVEAQSTWTKTSMASLWTSLWPIQTGILRWDQSLAEKVKMPAEALKDAGFRTAGIYRNGWLGTKFGFGQGFDTYYRPSTDIKPGGFERHNPSAHPLKGSDGDITESVFEFLRGYGRERFFLYLHLMDVHQYAYDVSTPVYGTAYMDSYDSAINWVDHNLGVIEKALDDAKLLDRTVLVISSDHGEAFREHGFDGHARTLYSETTRVPLIVSFPFLLPKGVVVNEQVRNLDVWPTIFDLLGLPPIEGAVGRSLLPLVEAAGRGQTVPDPPPPAFAHLDRTWGSIEQKPAPIVSVKKAGWKLIHSMNSKEPEELYDENKDPGDRKNVANEEGAARAELEPLISQYLALPLGPGGTPTKVEVDKDQLEQLRALGYIVH
ncbi:MAG TPA: sulfatase [Myxococcota bacterium]|nr:sulfatase [Myxococcota bacterium]